MISTISKNKNTRFAKVYLHQITNLRYDNKLKLFIFKEDI